MDQYNQSNEHENDMGLNLNHSDKKETPQQPAHFETNTNDGQFHNASMPNIQNVSNDKNGTAIASMVLGIVSIVLGCCLFISIPCAIVALVLGIMSLKSEKQGMAIAGIVMGGVMLTVMIILVISLVLFGNFSYFLQDAVDVFNGLGYYGL